jgi:hypothetical protein
LAQPGAGTILISEWIVGTPERQRAAAAALLGEWEQLSAGFRPEAFVQLACFASADGGVLLSHAQWASDDAHRAFVREHRAAMVGRIDRAVPGIERPGLVRFRLLHSIVPETAPQPADALVMLGAKARTHEDARRWADAVAAESRAARAARDAAVGPTHVLVSTDGRKALLLAPTTREDGWTPPLPATPAADVLVHPPQRYQLLGSVRGPRYADR